MKKITLSMKQKRALNMKAKKAAGLILVAASLSSGYAQAGLAELTYANELERQSALAILSTYNDLIANTGCYDGMQAPVTSNAAQGARACDGGTYELFKNVRKIVHTASEISKDDAATEFSLGLDLRGLGFALRWNAAEEYSAQGSLASDFIKGQFSGLSARLTALRLGATGFSLASNTLPNNQAYAPNRLRGGGASADEKDNADAFSRLGGFINYSFGNGSKTATNLEDAFDFDGSKINAGFDYRINNRWVVGAFLGYSDQAVDFDSAKSVVDGKIVADGFSLMPFVLFQAEQFYASASLGKQKLQFDSTRAIHYPSLNPNIPSPDTETKSKTNSDITSYSLELGYSIPLRQFSLEPFASINSSSTKIDAFVEDDINNDAFDLAVNKQNIKATTYALGVNLRYTFTPSFGVITPFASYQRFKQTNAKKQIIGSHYVNAVNSTNVFQLATDSPDDSYDVMAVGVSSVLRGGREATAGGAVAGGLQGFINYKIIQNLENYDMHVVELGMRYEF
jgi:outer membrane autotransporter protein